MTNKTISCLKKQMRSLILFLKKKLGNETQKEKKKHEKRVVLWKHKIVFFLNINSLEITL